MRLSALFLRICVFIIAAFGAVFAARAAVTTVETRSVVAVQEDLIDAGHNWASVIGDGLQVIIEGTAPSEATRFNAITTAGRVVDASRVIDNMSVDDTAGIAPPEFAIEILRNDAGVSLIGLIPAATDRDALADRITAAADGQPVTDLLEVANYPVPEHWEPAVNYALRALEQLPRSKISVSARSVTVKAISDSANEQRRLETSLARNTPEFIAVAVNITAPRPVISPFLTRFELDEEGARFIACAVDSAEAERKVVWAATQAGLEGRTNCTQALGAPSRTWGDAVSLSINAIAELGGGTVTVSNTDISLIAVEGTAQGLFDRVIGELENTLPDVYALSAELPRAPEAGDEGPPTFTATRSPEGAVQLRGRVPDDLMNSTAEQFAFAKFGQANVTMGTRVTEGLPAGWSVRVLAGVEALSALSNGAVTVQPDKVSVRGNTGSPTASQEIARLLIDKLGTAADVEIDVTYVKELDPIAGLPTPEECVAKITTVSETRKISFDPGSADLAANAQGIIDDIADILKKCANLRVRIAGYTDSQGREEMNQQLSQQRAQSVLDALRLRRVPVGAFEAIGYGEADPIADNDTEEGREANRRIEFSLIIPESTPEEPTALEELEAAVEDEAAASE